MKEANGYLGIAIRRICADLRLPHGDAFTQDWVYELAAPYRTDECLSKYIAAHGASGYGPHERHVLMGLILDVFNDMYCSGQPRSLMFWESISAALLQYQGEHTELIDYWSCHDSELEEAFAISPLIRGLRFHGPAILSAVV